MYKAVFLVSLWATAVCGLPAVIDIADFDTMRRLEQQMTDSVDKKDETSAKKDYGEGEYLEPDWNAEGSLEIDEELQQRSVRSVGSSYNSDYDSDECHHSHYHDDEENDSSSRSDHSSHDSSFSSSSSSSCCSSEEEQKLIEETTKTPEVIVATTTTTTIPEVIIATTTTPEVIIPTVTTQNPDEKVEIDRRISIVGPETRRKRMAWNVMRSSDEFEDDVKPVKMIWRWDDQEPELVPPKNNIFNHLTSGRKTDVLTPPIYNIREPCASIWERRDRRGICRPLLK